MFQAPYDPGASVVPVVPITVPVASIPSGTGSLTPSSNLKPKCGCYLLFIQWNYCAHLRYRNFKYMVIVLSTVLARRYQLQLVQFLEQYFLLVDHNQHLVVDVFHFPGSVLFDCDGCSVTVKGLQNGSAPTQYTGSISIGILLVPQ